MYMAFLYIYSKQNKRRINYTVSRPFLFLSKTSSTFLLISPKVHACPIHPNWIGPTVGTDDRTQRKSGREIYYALPGVEF